MRMLEFTEIELGTVALSTSHIISIVSVQGGVQNGCEIYCSRGIFHVKESYETVLESVRGDTHAQK